MLYPLLYQSFHCDLRKPFPTVSLVPILPDGKVPDLFEPGIYKQNMSVLVLVPLWGRGKYRFSGVGLWPFKR